MNIAVTGSRTPRGAVSALEQRGFRVILLPPHPALPEPVNCHADLLLFFAGKKVFTSGSYAKIAEQELSALCRLTGKTLIPTECEPGKQYPYEILFDAAPIGDLLFCLPEYTAKEIISLPEFRMVPIRQGYAKCSILPVTENAIVTSDTGIARAAEAEGTEVLKIAPGKILLPGYDTGFIGGCASFSPDHDYPKIFFCGDPILHQNGADILNFCRSHGKEPVSLCDGALTDVGTIFLISS